MVGDTFLEYSFNSLQKWKNIATVTNKAVNSTTSMAKPFIWQNFNIDRFTPNYGVLGPNRFLNPIIDAMNKNPHLPQIILMVPDVDMITSLLKIHKLNSMMLGTALHYIIKQTDIVIARRRLDLVDKRPGAALSQDYPKIIWVRMLIPRKHVNWSPDWSI